jgi:hypothetical protein
MSDDCEKALRYNEGKPKWTLVHFKALLPLVRVLEYGTIKYSKDDWKNPMDKKEILDSLLRHVIELTNGEEIDKESNQPHIGHIMANAMFYQYHVDTSVETDKNQLKLDFNG